jgi:hypothetical protein
MEQQREETKKIKNILMNINKTLPVDLIDIILEYSRNIFQFEKDSFYSFKDDGYCQVINKTKKYLHFIIRNDNPSNFTPYKGIKCFKSKIEYDRDGNEFVIFKSIYFGKNTEWFKRHIYCYYFTTSEEHLERCRIIDKNDILSSEKIEDNCKSFLEYHNQIIKY